jgi:hypothetical protein
MNPRKKEITPIITASGTPRIHNPSVTNTATKAMEMNCPTNHSFSARAVAWATSCMRPRRCFGKRRIALST